MSGRLVSAVFDSTLPAWLKPYAAACASFALDDGTRIFPTVLRVARMVGRCERATQAALLELRSRGILTVEAAPGRNRATRYRFHAAALPSAADPDQLSLFSTGAMPRTIGKTGFPQLAQASTRNGLHPRGAVDCTRSVSDPSFPNQVRARAEIKKTGT